MRYFTTLILLLFIKFCYANMASPFQEGTLGSNAFSSRDIDIIKEKISVNIDKDFKTAFYKIDYYIYANFSGKQIPLLFNAIDYSDYFRVWVDGEEILLKDIPDEYTNSSNSIFSKFTNSLEIRWNENERNQYELSDLKYFETNLIKGEHKISVEYVASVFINKLDWIKEYSFDYSLLPAKNWKSFGVLEITINANDFGKTITTNLGQPDSGKLETIAIWNFDKLPVDYFTITYKPQMTSFTKALIEIGPIGLTLIIFLLFTLIHLMCIKQYRKKKPTGKSWVVVVGSIFIPLIILIAYMYTFRLIDYTIGNDASRYHGYTFFAIFWYPFFTPIYWTLMWIADKLFKKK